MYFFCALLDITKHKLEIFWATQRCADSPVANYARWLSKSKGTLDLHIKIICFHAASLRSKYNPDLLAIRQRSPAGRRSGMLRLQLLKTKPCYHSQRTWPQQPLRCIRCHECQPFELLFYLFTPSWVAVFFALIAEYPLKPDHGISWTCHYLRTVALVEEFPPAQAVQEQLPHFFRKDANARCAGLGGGTGTSPWARICQDDRSTMYWITPLLFCSWTSIWAIVACQPSWYEP